MRGGRGILLVGVSLLAALGVACSSAGETAPSPDDAARERDLASLAKSGGYVLVLDVEPPRSLTLVSGGATLRSFPVHGLEVGTLRVAFRRTEPVSGWWAAVRSGGRLDPPRELEREIVRPPAPAGASEPPEPSSIVPPTPEQRIPAPDAYRIRFDGGFALEIVGDDGDSPRGGRIEAWREALGGDGAFPRLRLTLDAVDAAELYRSLPEGAALVLTGPPGAAAASGG